MRSVDSKPLVSQANSLVQVTCGFAKGAKET